MPSRKNCPNGFFFWLNLIEHCLHGEAETGPYEFYGCALPNARTAHMTQRLRLARLQEDRQETEICALVRAYVWSRGKRVCIGDE